MNTNKMRAIQQITIREKAARLLTSRFFILEVIILSSFLMWWQGGAGFLIGLGLALVTFWAVQWDWSFFGLSNVSWKSTIAPAIGYTMIIFLLNDFIIEPLTTIYTNQTPDLSNFDGMRGNVANLWLMLVIIWTIAAFGEEFFYRGYFMKQIAILFGNNKSGWIIGVILSSIMFGLVHAYQGNAGMISTGLVGLILAIAFYHNRQNLLVCMLAHGLIDTIGILMIYYGTEKIVIDYMINLYQTIL